MREVRSRFGNIWVARPSTVALPSGMTIKVTKANDARHDENRRSMGDSVYVWWWGSDGGLTQLMRARPVSASNAVTNPGMPAQVSWLDPHDHAL